MAERIVFGYETTCVPDIKQNLERTFQLGFDFSIVPLVHPRHRRVQHFPNGSPITRDAPLTRSDTLLTGQEWTNSIVGTLSPWIDLDSSIDMVRKNSEIAFKQEVNWAAHLGISTVVLPTPSLSLFNYANHVNFAIATLKYASIWVKIPLAPKGVSKTPNQASDPWEWWNMLRNTIEHNPKVSVALELPRKLPDEKVLARWLGEPVRAVIIPTSSFLTNESGYPVLSKAHQVFLHKLMRFPPMHLIVRGNLEHHFVGEDAYAEYLRHLLKTLPELAMEEKLSLSYNDYLQAPLQPLMDNLESGVYEVFEKDPVKYRLYEEAVYKALVERFPTNERIPVVMVLGAGRGPLVKASLRAAEKAQKEIKVWAVEKNPNAIVTLMNLKHEVWGDKVTVVSSDMRDWKSDQKADILVSELLGSFGDNELSPECLDGAQHLLREDGISIPRDYTSYICPMSSEKLFNEVKNFDDLEHFETPFVVKLHNIWLMSDIKALFKFEHPNYETDGTGKIDNTRFMTVEFDVTQNGTMHGFAGYFDSTLYGDVLMSIHPKTHSPGMFSWFPIYFPLRSPVYVTAGSKIRATFWRKVSSKKVWYEWTVSSPTMLPIHNPNGRSYWIGL